mmetsp:Transcript_97264/g.208681  ORF Transcript_97264/g.208681 Transcript_97264/m.208681 type:complete len:326 (-) Transcript_97264:175-1152(-)
MDGDNVSPPPVGGLGNYKGVMLCNRPPEGPVSVSNDGALPFKSMIAASWGEQLGLPPCRKAEPSREVKTCGPSAALRRHCKWIKELQEQVRDDKISIEDSKREQEERKKKMADVFKKQRDLIRDMKKQRHKSNIEPHEIEAVMKPKSSKKKTSETSQKPLWAMTESEKDQFEDQEGDDLLRFAEEIDFDSYIDDLQFRQCLSAVADRAKRLQREQDAFKDSILNEFNGQDDEEQDDDFYSELGQEEGRDGSARKVGSRRRGGGGSDDRPDWDASTTCGDEAPNAADGNMRDAAARLLEANPNLKAVHSKGSVQRLVEKAVSEAGS